MIWASAAGMAANLPTNDPGGDVAPAFRGVAWFGPKERLGSYVISSDSVNLPG